MVQWENGLRIELLLNGDQILGIGNVELNNVSLRNPFPTGIPYIEKINNGKFQKISQDSCLFEGYETKGEAVIVHSQLVIEKGSLNLDWIFVPWDLKVEENQYNGFGFRFRVSSPIEISKMGFRSSWELNESVVGKILFSRRIKTEWEHYFKSRDFFQSKVSSLFGQSQPPVYQYDESGALVSFIWPPEELENTIEKEIDSQQLWFNDKYLFGKTKEAESSFRVVLYSSKGGLDEYTYLLDKISEEYRKFYGLKEFAPLPTVLATDYLVQEIKAGQAPLYKEVADRWLQDFSRHSFKQVMIIPIWVSDGRIGGSFGGNRLATHDIEVLSEDEEGLKYFVETTHNLGMNLIAWFSTCYSKKSPLYRDNQWQIRDAKGKYPSAHSGEVYLMSYRSGYLTYALKKLKEIKRLFGFDGLWHDSFTAAFKTDYSQEESRPPIDQLVQFLSATQEMGYLPFVESIGPFGIPSVGSASLSFQEKDKERRNIKQVFEGKEYLAYKTSFVLWHPDDFSPLKINYYKFLANKAVPFINYSLLNEKEKELVSKSNKDYIEVLPFMDKRYVLNKGILWEDQESNTRVLFSFNEFFYKSKGEVKEVFDITDGIDIKINNGGFLAYPKHTYRIR
ncbi:hypothetical protein J7K24_02345 [bacterium]|nr:hypothetical protein [bacterium]